MNKRKILGWLLLSPFIATAFLMIVLITFIWWWVPVLFAACMTCLYVGVNMVVEEGE